MKPILFALFAACLSAQEPAGVIEGRLRDGTTRAPLADAKIALRGPANRSVTTAPGGTFHFDQLAAGDYEITVQKDGYLDSRKGTVRQTIRLKPGAVTETTVIDLTPLGAVEGAVLDEAGRPLADVTVNLAGTFHPTDREGRYAFEDVVPGSYQVAVGVPHPVRARDLARDEGSGDYYGYAPAQYYPGADDPRLAIPVVIAPGARLRNVDLRLRRTLLVEFTGHLIDMAGGEPVLNAAVQLNSSVDGPRDPLWNRPAADGTFRFSLIQPGSYTLSVLRPDRTPLPYVAPIQIGKAGAEDLPVTVPPYTRIQGSIQMRDPKQRVFGSATIRLTHRSGVSSSCSTRPDGTFEFENVPPGQYQVEVQGRNLRLPSDPKRLVSVKSIRFGGENALRRTVTIGENGNPPLEIQFTDEPAGIAGRVVDADSARGPFVVTVAALAPRRSTIGLMIAMPEFQFPELDPGDYEITAVRGMRGPGINSNSNRTCEETLRVTVREGAVSTITLRPCQ